MKPAPPETAELLARLRQQLILAQVRIMELEDVRDTLNPRLTELEQLLQGAQTLADQKMAEAAHLNTVLADLQKHCDHLGQTLQQTNQELAASRTGAADSAAQVVQRDESLRRLESVIRQLESELLAMKSTRSWRWTAWLRSLGGGSK